MSHLFRTALVALVLVSGAGLGAQPILSPAAGNKPAIQGSLALPSTASPSGGQAAALQQAVQARTLQQDATRAQEPADPPVVGAALVRPPARQTTPGQFQRFVQETTGLLLPLYGHELFDTPQAYAADSALPAPSDYLLGPGDEVRLEVWGPVDFSASLTIDRNGQVTLPKVGVVTLAGIAVRDLDRNLRGHLAKVFNNFSSSASLGRLRGIQVYVVGQARQPGTYQMSSVSTLVNALFASGGPNANGSMRSIELKRAGRTVSRLDLYDFIARGDKTGDIPLLSGDVIVIPPAGPRVAVAGAFDQAAIFELKPGAGSIADILNLGGGVPALAQTRKALLERISPAKNPPREVQELTLDPQGLSQPLRDGDVLTLLAISPAFGNAVTLQGTVAAPLRYSWFPGMRILDLIPEREALITPDYYKRKNLLVQKADIAQDAGGKVASRIRGIADQINWDYAVIERMDRVKLSTELIPFNLGRAVLQQDAAHNLPLESGDVVTVLSQNDLRLPQDRQIRLVRVEGEVAAPGIYQAIAGETLPQLIRRIGGLTPQAYVFGAELNRESVRIRQQENLDALTRRLEAQLQSQAVAATANRNIENVAQAQFIQQQQQAQLRAQLERLRTLRSNGRLALELDPQAQSLAALPALPLEDGDRFVVPAVPGYVAAFGSVNNENVFVFRPGRTVGDILRSAGLTEEAEPDQAFVLRADGSIIARRDHSSMFRGGFESIAVMPGDTVVVPAQADRETPYNFWTRALKDWTQIFSNFGLGLAAIKTIKSL